MDAILVAVMLLSLIWLLFELVYDFGPIVIILFLTGIGALVVAVMTLIDIRSTWRPIALFLLAGVSMTLLR